MGVDFPANSFLNVVSLQFQYGALWPNMDRFAEIVLTTYGSGLTFLDLRDMDKFSIPGFEKAVKLINKDTVTSLTLSYMREFQHECIKLLFTSFPKLNRLSVDLSQVTDEHLIALSGSCKELKDIVLIT